MRTSTDSGNAADPFFSVADESVDLVEKVAINSVADCVVPCRHSRLNTSPLIPGQALPERGSNGDDAGGTPLVVKTGRDVEKEGYSYKHLWRVQCSILSSI